MCGIAGIITKADPANLQCIMKHMLHLLAHRGPDDEGIWQQDAVCLGHRRLSILDLSRAGHQPFSYMNGRYVIVFNGEIYNYLELRQVLIQKGYEFHSKTDTEVIVAAYDCFGSECVDHFNGMWAFAIWDCDSQSLFASRDRFGKKPFYYVSISHSFVFASEIRAVLAGSEISPNPNIDRVYDYALSRQLDHTEQTMFSGVYQLPPGHNLTIKDGTLTIKRYWTLHPTRKREFDDNLIGEFRELFLDAVRIRLRSDVPVGCTLSGGLDSSAITCAAAQMYDSPDGFPLASFSTRFKELSSEAAAIPSIHARYNLRKFESWPDARQFKEDLEQVIWAQEEPFGDGSMVSHYGLMRLAREHGVPVILGGQGGDEILGGYTSHVWALMGEYLRKLRLGAYFDLLSQYPSGQNKTIYHGIVHTAWHLLPQNARDRLAALIGQRKTAWLCDDIIYGRRRVSSVADQNLPYFDNYLLTTINKTTLPAFLHYEDRNSMAFGVETRAPFLDFRLAELMFSAVPKARIKCTFTKNILRCSMVDIVPNEILSRLLKEGYPSPLARWLRENREYVYSILTDRQTQLIPFVSPAGLEKVLSRFFNNESEPVGSVWRALCVCLWYKNLLLDSRAYRFVR